MGSDHTKIDCATHGTDQVSAIVCRHMINGSGEGFVENSSEPADQQAWCDACEALFAKEKSMTRRFREYNDFAVVCVACYAAIKRRQTAPDYS